MLYLTATDRELVCHPVLILTGVFLPCATVRTGIAAVKGVEPKFSTYTSLIWQQEMTETRLHIKMELNACTKTKRKLSFHLFCLSVFTEVKENLLQISKESRLYTLNRRKQ